MRCSLNTRDDSVEEVFVSKKVIVIDDSQAVRAQVSLVLTTAGYDVIEAEDGVQGAGAIQANRDASLAICDVNMPNLGGLDMLDLVRADKAVPDFPVIMLTTEGRPDLIDRAKKAGAKGWVVKPFKPNLLLAAVKKIAGEPS